MEYRTDRNFILCSHIVETVKEPERQNELIKAYHEGKTNHRGVPETLAALQRRYYWHHMRRTIRANLRSCTICNQAKYDRHPIVVHPEVTHTPNSPLLDIQVDIFTWEGLYWLTIVDTFSKLAMAHHLPNKTADAVWEGMFTWISCYGVPHKITSDGGREFKNARTTTECSDLGMQWHFNSPGNPPGRGAIERLHNTLGEHLRLFQLHRGLGAHAAMPRAVLAYNNTIHSATGFTPVEVVFGHPLRNRGDILTTAFMHLRDAVLHKRKQLANISAKTHSKLLKEKLSRANRICLAVPDGSHKVKLGMTVYRQPPSSRRKGDRRYEGPFRVIALREHNIISIQELTGAQRVKHTHIRHLRIPLDPGTAETGVPQIGL